MEKLIKRSRRQSGETDSKGAGDRVEKLIKRSQRQSVKTDSKIARDKENCPAKSAEQKNVQKLIQQSQQKIEKLQQSQKDT